MYADLLCKISLSGCLHQDPVGPLALTPNSLFVDQSNFISLKSRGQRIQTVVGDNWETSAKSCGPKHSERPECTGRQVGDKPEIMRADNPEIMRQRIQSVVRD